MLLERDTSLASAAAEAPLRIASSLSILEADRGLTRAIVVARLPRLAARDAARGLVALAAVTVVAEMDGQVLEHARQIFPVEPVRSLDALHLATALLFRQELGEMTFASCDRRIRENAAALGFPLLPP